MTGHIQRNHYATYASVAAHAERNTDYLNAATLWDNAAHHARSAMARNWAERRREFCQNAAAKEWGKSDERAAI
ncbi:ANR family transcriptional regulator [Xenorhabdus nematophila]|uniref:ANR family transcriptional regulator n=1 Tax=Xenorhabdus nematophila TaxID=628 RepID=UPI0032B79FDD